MERHIRLYRDHEYLLEEGDVYGSLYYWAMRLGLTPDVAQGLVRDETPRLSATVRGAERGPFYRDREILAAFEQTYGTLPMLDHTGGVHIDGKRFATLRRLRRTLHCTKEILLDVVNGSEVIARVRAWANGFVEFAYDEDATLAAYEFARPALRHADRDGCILVDSIRHKTIEGWKREVGVYGTTLLAAMQHRCSTPVRGYLLGRQYDFYAEPDVRIVLEATLNRMIGNRPNAAQERVLDRIRNWLNKEGPS